MASSPQTFTTPQQPFNCRYPIVDQLVPDEPDPWVEEDVDAFAQYKEQERFQ